MIRASLSKKRWRAPTLLRHIHHERDIVALEHDAANLLASVLLEMYLFGIVKHEVHVLVKPLTETKETIQKIMRQYIEEACCF